jgi:hypothetical protein
MDAFAFRMSRRIVVLVAQAVAAAAEAVTADAIREMIDPSMALPCELTSLRRPFSTGSMLRRTIASSVTMVSLPDLTTRARPAGPSAIVVMVYSDPGATVSGTASAKMPSTVS